MRTISIINQKGGCGKTTTSINLAACMARLGHKTLLVDMDPQGHCGVGLAVPEDQIERSVYETLIDGVFDALESVPPVKLPAGVVRKVYGGTTRLVYDSIRAVNWMVSALGNKPSGD